MRPICESVAEGSDALEETSRRLRRGKEVRVKARSVRLLLCRVSTLIFCREEISGGRERSLLCETSRLRSETRLEMLEGKKVILLLERSSVQRVEMWQTSSGTSTNRLWSRRSSSNEGQILVGFEATPPEYER